MRIFEQPSETFMYIIQFQMWLGGDGIPMLCDVWRGFNVCALNFNEFPFFALSGRENKAFSHDIQMQYIRLFVRMH